MQTIYSDIVQTGNADLHKQTLAYALDKGEKEPKMEKNLYDFFAQLHFSGTDVPEFLIEPLHERVSGVLSIQGYLEVQKDVATHSSVRVIKDSFCSLDQDRYTYSYMTDHTYPERNYRVARLQQFCGIEIIIGIASSVLASFCMPGAVGLCVSMSIVNGAARFIPSEIEDKTDALEKETTRIRKAFIEAVQFSRNQEGELRKKLINQSIFVSQERSESDPLTHKFYSDILEIFDEMIDYYKCEDLPDFIQSQINMHLDGAITPVVQNNQMMRQGRIAPLDNPNQTS